MKFRACDVWRMYTECLSQHYLRVQWENVSLEDKIFWDDVADKLTLVTTRKHPKPKKGK